MRNDDTPHFPPQATPVATIETGQAVPEMIVSLSDKANGNARSLTARRFNYRKLFWKWHRYAGLLAGPLLILIAVTGAILVYSPEIDHWLRPDLWRIDVPATGSASQRATDQAMVETVLAAFPDERLIFYRQQGRSDEPYHFLLFGNPEKGIRDVWVNPHTGGIVGNRMRETSFVRIVEQLHRRLLTGEIGSSVVELITGWAIVLTLTGCFMWWPATLKALRHGLTLSFRGSPYKVNWRIHNTIGAWATVCVLLMCLTGMVFSTYSGMIYRSIMNATGGPNLSGPPPQSTLPATAGAVRVSIDEVLRSVRRELPNDSPLIVQWPAGETACIVVMTDREERPQWANRSRYRSWSFDQYTGELLASSGWNDQHPMMHFWTISQAIHYGSIFGWPTKIVALVACLAVPVLSISGYLIWWWKRQGKQKAANRVATKPSTVATIETAPVSRGLIVSLIVVGILFPTIGLSFVVLLAWEGATGWLQQRLRSAA